MSDSLLSGDDPPLTDRAPSKKTTVNKPIERVRSFLNFVRELGPLKNGIHSCTQGHLREEEVLDNLYH